MGSTPTSFGGWGLRSRCLSPIRFVQVSMKAWAVGKPAVNVHTVALSSYPDSANLHIPIEAFCIEHDASASIENTGFALTRDDLVTL